MTASNETSAQADPELRRALEEAAQGLLYGSEIDEPFAFFFLPGGGDAPAGAEDFARKLGEAQGEPAEERSLEKFFARHIERVSAADPASTALVPRYEALRETLRSRLQGTIAYRLGAVNIRCYVVGGDGKGNLAGLSTKVLET